MINGINFPVYILVYIKAKSAAMVNWYHFLKA